MNVRNCRNCKRLFNYISGPHLCPACREEQEKLFQDVKKYVNEHRGVTIPELAEEFDIEQAQIRQWIKEERLEFADDSGIKLACESCGALINCGRFCEACKASLTGGLKSITNAARKPQDDHSLGKNPNNQNRMHYIRG